jgi:MFS family permease
MSSVSDKKEKSAESSSFNESDTVVVEKAENEKEVIGTDPERHGFDAQRTKALIRKIDWTLIPFLALLYLLSFLDRTNIGNARLADLEKDLGMFDIDYNIALGVFFPWYVAAEIPSNLAMKRFRPSIWIPSIMVAWGIICTLMGLVNNFPGLVAARCALGVAEGGLFPGITY